MDVWGMDIPKEIKEKTMMYLKLSLDLLQNVMGSVWDYLPPLHNIPWKSVWLKHYSDKFPFILTNKHTWKHNVLGES